MGVIQAVIVEPESPGRLALAEIEEPSPDGSCSAPAPAKQCFRSRGERP